MTPRPPIARVVLDGVGLVADGPVTVLDGVSVSWAERRLGVIGANGSGKSTLLRLLNALAVPTSGSVRIELADGTSVDPVRDARRARSLVGFVFTNPDAQIVMPTPAEDVALSLRRLRLDRDERDGRVAAVLAGAGLSGRADTSTFDLSSGQKQLLAIAAVLEVDPALVVLDEPTTLLDLRNAVAVEERIASLDRHVVLASHDLDLVRRCCERVLVMHGGRIVADEGPGDAVATYRRLVLGAGRST